MALDIIGIDNIVVAQNKVDLVDQERAQENYQQIQEFVEGTVAEGAPIVPVSAQQGVNTDLLIQAIQEEIPTPERDPDVDARMMVARSFDINRPGTTWEDLKGGVLGGSLVQGSLEVDDEIQLRPGREVEEGGQTEWRPRRDLRPLDPGRRRFRRRGDPRWAARRRYGTRSLDHQGRRAGRPGRRPAGEPAADARTVHDGRRPARTDRRRQRRRGRGRSLLVSR